jgi:hypothetical protein
VRTVVVAPEVAAMLGVEELARLAGPEWTTPVQCWQCERWIQPDEDAALVVLRVTEFEERLPGSAPQMGVHTHPGCLSSQVRTVSLAEIQARRSTAPEDTGGTTVDVVATTIETEDGTSAFPVVMISYQADLLAAATGRDRVDLLASGLLNIGWHPITSLTRPPAAAPAGYRVRFTHLDGNATAPGVLEVIGPDGEVETSAGVAPTRFWRPAIIRSGRTVVLQGSHFLTDWERRGRAGVKKAIRDGLVVGGIVPVELNGPGNDAPGSVYR